jgi:DNA-binding transcriptional LysR family regulator
MPGGTGHGIIERTLVAHGLEDRIALRVQNFLVLPSIVAASELIAIVPHSVGSQISPQDAVKLLPLPVDIPAFDVRQCWHERYHDDPGHRWLRSSSPNYSACSSQKVGTNLAAVQRCGRTSCTLIKTMDAIESMQPGRRASRVK